MKRRPATAAAAGAPPSHAPGHAPDHAIDRAIDWAVRLESGTATDAERGACAAWRAAHPAHETAWQQVQQIEQAFRRLPAGQGTLALDALQSAQRLQGDGRRRALKLLGTAAIGTVLAALAARLLPWQQRARYAAAVGDRRSVMLADGTRLQLNTDSEAEVVFSPLRRLIVLRHGELFVDTGRDADAVAGRRPFWVETAQARLEAIGTRFGVRRSAGETRLYVVEGSVAIHADDDGAPVLARAGDTFLIPDQAAAPVRLRDLTFTPEAWTGGALVAKQMRLDAFVAELARYRGMPLRCDAGAGALRVSGVFQLDGPDPVGRALEVLAATLPLRVVQQPGATLLVARH
ncbi:FecR family protein [Cupriavidus sp. 30B13]|uniref:FecR family protein n=1 Tax=Cupriavidus sp. 30B13 TaxID=3384241 RepID=UPI003B921509